MFLMMPSTKIEQMVSLHQTLMPQELQIRNIFKRHFLLNHWSKFTINSQDRFSRWLLL